MPKKQDISRQVSHATNKTSIVKMPSAPSRIAKCVKSVLNALSKDITQESIDYLRSCYKQPECPEIDYDYLATSFTYLYFLENFWKSASIFVREPPPLTRRVVDVGCGSGTTALAFLSLLEEALHEVRWKIDVTLVDRSKSQLALAKKILSCAQGKFHHLEIVPHFQCMDLDRWKPEVQSTDVVLFGHVLNENRSRVKSLLEKAFSAVCDDGRIYIIEREDDVIWHIIDDCATHLALPTSSGITKLETNNIDPDLPKASNKRYITTRYLVLHLPERKQHVNLVRLYFQAWNTRSCKLLENIFEPNAEYHEKPYDSPLLGIEQIKRYWKENVLSQRDVHLRILNVAYGGNNAFVEWEAEFACMKQKKQIKGALILKINPKNNRVSMLHEYFRSRNLRGVALD